MYMKVSKTRRFGFQIAVALIGITLSVAAPAASKRGYTPKTCDQYSPQILHKKALRYRHIIHSASHKYGVNANLIKAVITAETCFRLRARSHKGAAGLMQLMPATAKRWGVTNRYNVSQNIHAGTLYLSWLLHRYGGSVRHAVAAYNSGEGTVDRYGLGVPYRETQNYMRMVMNAYTKMNGGRAPEFMRTGGLKKVGLRKSKQYVRDASRLQSAQQLQARIEQEVDQKTKKRSKTKKKQVSRKSRKAKRLLPSCMTVSRKLHKATTHSDRRKTQTRTFYYKVKKGDSLGKIMKATGKSTTTIKRYNNIKRNLIKPGQKLKISECRLK
ncbi:MAG: Membrane-bound lytic murein transglycosylase D precursor (EC [uncultured Thiotrichaceae bacterium]|uniref:Membrane-bound lytic murein transglycosylase D (EC) n=1 Tax=uncultured Thiotrichaceae bacterium TaxID=298394 RepID=A0A6S6T2L0_9GAMM|nr:MAG: Membrane-bound lytic murein transglycosylase D precursor (EC [uncultured Thiotrichaceae bacterium]